MTAYRVHVHDHADQGRWLGSVDFPKRPTAEQVNQMAVLAKPGRYEIRLSLLSGEDEISAGGWLQGEPAPEHRASCGHPANEDGECGCSSWPERAPYVQDPENPTAAELAAALKRGLADGSLTTLDDWLAASAPERKAMTPDEFAGIVLEQTQRRLKISYPASPQWEWERVQVIVGPVYTKVDIGPEHNKSGKYMIENATGRIYGIKGYGKVHKGHQYGTLATVDDWYWGGYVGQRRDSFRPVNMDTFWRTAPRWNCVSFPLDGPHYTPGSGRCEWCGKSTEKIAAEYAAAERCCEGCSS